MPWRTTDDVSRRASDIINAFACFNGVSFFPKIHSVLEETEACYKLSYQALVVRCWDKPNAMVGSCAALSCGGRNVQARQPVQHSLGQVDTQPAASTAGAIFQIEASHDHVRTRTQRISQKTSVSGIDAPTNSN